MENSSIISTLEKLSFQISTLGKALDHEKHSIEALIISEDWSKNELNAADDIFDKWDNKLKKGEKLSSREFEHDFQKALNVSYQGLKPIILSFYRSECWMEVCEAYVDSFNGAPSCEYHLIMQRKR